MSKQTEIRNACERFFADWNRGGWMQAHGEWASEEWAGEREAFDEARDALEESLTAALAAVKKCDSNAPNVPNVFGEIEEARKALEAAAKALDGQVRANDSDYIAEGTIDPDEVSGEAEALGVGSSWQEWYCKEGWSAYRSGAALYLRWYRDPYSGANRHARDLWVLVDGEFFEDEAESNGDHTL